MTQSLPAIGLPYAPGSIAAARDQALAAKFGLFIRLLLPWLIERTGIRYVWLLRGQA